MQVVEILLALILLALLLRVQKIKEQCDKYLPWFILIGTSILFIFLILSVSDLRILTSLKKEIAGITVAMLFVWPIFLIINLFEIVSGLYSAKKSKRALWIYLGCLLINVLNFILFKALFTYWQPA